MNIRYVWMYTSEKGAMGSACLLPFRGYFSVRCSNSLCDVSAHRQKDNRQAPWDPRRLFPH